MLQKLHKNRGGFTLVEIMIVVAIIALLAAIAVPNFLRARKRSQATRILEDLRVIDSATEGFPARIEDVRMPATRNGGQAWRRLSGISTWRNCRRATGGARTRRWRGTTR